MLIIALLVGILFVFVGVAVFVYALARGFGGQHKRAALLAFASILPTYAGLLLLNNDAELATGAGLLCGAVAMVGLAVWVWQRTPRPIVEQTQPQTQPQAQPHKPGRNWTPASERVAAGMRGKYADYKRVSA